VAVWLGLSDVSAMLECVDEDEKIIKILPPDQCLAGLQPNTEYQFLTEFGFYELLMRSQTPQAKRFKKGAKQVLRDVRIGSGIMDAVGNELGVPRLIHSYFAAGSRGEAMGRIELCVFSHVSNRSMSVAPITGGGEHSRGRTYPFFFLLIQSLDFRWL
jgi:hypothetical protein